MNVVSKPVMKDAKVRIAPKNVKFTGEPVSPVFTVTLKGAGYNYSGTKKVTYKIGAVKLPDIWGGIMKIFQNL